MDRLVPQELDQLSIKVVLQDQECIRAELLDLEFINQATQESTRVELTNKALPAELEVELPAINLTNLAITTKVVPNALQAPLELLESPALELLESPERLEHQEPLATSSPSQDQVNIVQVTDTKRNERQ